MAVITPEDELHSFLRARWLQASPPRAPVITHFNPPPLPTIPHPKSSSPSRRPTVLVLYLPPPPPPLSSDPTLSPSPAPLSPGHPCSLSLLLKLIVTRSQTHRGQTRRLSSSTIVATHLLDKSKLERSLTLLGITAQLPDILSSLEIKRFFVFRVW